MIWKRHESNKSVIVKEDACPYCWSRLNAATVIGSDAAVPKPGDFSCCANCGELSVFDEALGLAPLAPEELAMLPPSVKRDMQEALGIAGRMAQRKRK